MLSLNPVLLHFYQILLTPDQYYCILISQNFLGVEAAEPDLKNSQVTVRGAFDPPKLVDYVYKKTGKRAVIVKQEPEKKEEKGKDGDGAKEAKKGEEGGGDNQKNKTTGEEENKEEKQGDKKSDSEAKPTAEAIEETKMVELMKNEYHYYPQYAMEMYAYPPPPPPQIFSDENPNACSAM